MTIDDRLHPINPSALPTFDHNNANNNRVIAKILLMSTSGQQQSLDSAMYTVSQKCPKFDWL